jgi:protein-L-isoaspartate(D-aspartate) O-methyltransferase
MTEHSTEQARFNMIEQQIRPWEVLDERVLSIMTSIAREAYVPDAYAGLAFADIEVPIAGGQHMMAPRLVGRMLQYLNIQTGDKVLEIGAGTGYTAACLAGLGGTVTSVELNPELVEQARANLSRQKVQGVDVRQGDGLAEPVQGGPFDAIAVTGSLPSDQLLPDLEAQLEPGGRLFVVIGEAPAMEALLITRISARDFRRESLLETVLPALDNAPKAEHFIF